MRPKYIVFMRARPGNPALLFVVKYIRKHGPAYFSYSRPRLPIQGLFEPHLPRLVQPTRQANGDYPSLT
jgi:hypothetical protein